MRKIHSILLVIALLAILPCYASAFDNAPEVVQSTNTSETADIKAPLVITTSNQAIKATTAPAIVTSQSAISNFEYFLSINITTNKLTLYQYGKKVSSFDVATGKIIKGASLTPSGKFTIVKKVKNPSWGGGGYAEPVKGGAPNNPLGHFWMGLSCGKNPGGTYGIHGNIDESSIGKPVSHGCIRMHNSDIETLFDTIPNNTNVWIGNKKLLGEWNIPNFD